MVFSVPFYTEYLFLDTHPGQQKKKKKHPISFSDNENKCCSQHRQVLASGDLPMTALQNNSN